MAIKLPAAEAANVAIQSIGCGYDVSLDLRLKNRKRRYHSDLGSNPYRNCRLIEIEEDEGRDIMLPGGLLVLNVSQSIKCDEGENSRLQSDVLSFEQMSQQFNQELSLDGEIPSGLFNSMFEFSGNSQKDASSTKTLVFDGVFISLYNISLEESQIVLCDHVKRAVPSPREHALVARFIKKFGTHIIVGVKMGGKEVIYTKQHHASSLKPADVKKKLKAMADKSFLESHGHSENISQSDKDLVSICKRRGGSDDKSLKHNEWLHTVQSEPDVITMSFIPITSLLNGVSGSGYLSHAINLYLRYKPPIEELHRFLEFQLPVHWSCALWGELPTGPPRKQKKSLKSIFSGQKSQKLFVNTNPIYSGKKPVTGLQLNLSDGHLAIHLQHLSILPKSFQLEDSVTGTGIFNPDTVDRRYYEKVQVKDIDYICTAPVESEDGFSIVTGAQLLLREKVLFLLLYFSKLLGCTTDKNPEWDQLLYRKPFKCVRGPHDSPGYWVVTGARLVVDKGRISLAVKYSLPRMLADEEVVD